MDKLYNTFIKKFEPEEKLKKATKKVISKYEKKLPKSIIELWENNGFGNYGFGIIKVINPEEYINYFRLIFKDDNCIPFLMDSFGNIFYIRENEEKVYVLNTDYSFIDICQYTFDSFIEFLTSDFFINNYLFKELYEDSLVKGKIPNNDEILIFNPPAILGGKKERNSIVVKNATNYLDFLIPMLVLRGIQDKTK